MSVITVCASIFNLTAIFISSRPTEEKAPTHNEEILNDDGCHSVLGTLRSLPPLFPTNSELSTEQSPMLKSSDIEMQSVTTENEANMVEIMGSTSPAVSRSVCTNAKDTKRTDASENYFSVGEESSGLKSSEVPEDSVLDAPMQESIKEKPEHAGVTCISMTHRLTENRKATGTDVEMNIESVALTGEEECALITSQSFLFNSHNDSPSDVACNSQLTDDAFAVIATPRDAAVICEKTSLFEKFKSRSLPKKTGNVSCEHVSKTSKEADAETDPGDIIADKNRISVDRINSFQETSNLDSFLDDAEGFLFDPVSEGSTEKINQGSTLV